MAETLLFFFKQLILVIIEVLDIAMLIRALLSWVDPMQEWKISSFLAAVTEPIILPFRKLCAKKRWFEGFPLDMPFLMALLALIAVRLIVGAL